MPDSTSTDRRVPGPPFSPGEPADAGPRLGRRGLLGGWFGLLLAGTAGGALAACDSATSGAATAAPVASAPGPDTVGTRNPVVAGTSVPGPSGSAGQGGSGGASSADLPGLEELHGARIGVYALDTGSGRSFTRRAGERFAMCSTFTVLAVGALLNEVGAEGLGRGVGYFEEDLVDPSPVTAGRTAMTLDGLCAAALQYGDATAANLLLAELGGPGAVTRFARSLGDQVTRLDRREPALNAAEPGDERDTSTPKLLGTALYTLIEGDTLTEVARRRLKDWMLGNTTGDARIRAAVPAGWKVADRTGDGSYGAVNDVALLYPKGNRPPVVLTVMADAEDRGTQLDDSLIVRAAQIALADVLKA